MGRGNMKFKFKVVKPSTDSYKTEVINLHRPRGEKSTDFTKLHI